MADVDMTDAPASTDVVKKNTAVVETKAKKAEGKPRFEVKKLTTVLSVETISWICALSARRTSHPPPQKSAQLRGVSAITRSISTAFRDGSRPVKCVLLTTEIGSSRSTAVKGQIRSWDARLRPLEHAAGRDPDEEDILEDFHKARKHKPRSITHQEGSSMIKLAGYAGSKHALSVQKKERI